MICRKCHFHAQVALLLIALALGGILGQTLLPAMTQAQVTTAITSDGTLATQVNPNGNTHDITGGNRPGDGPNLFHSFGQFSVGTGDIANFFNETGLPTENILSRVTGGDPSQIFGTIQTTDFGSANLFLMNPTGVLFGTTASLNVSGSFHVTTADYLRLTDNVQFTAVPGPSDAVLSIAPVAAYGFLNESPAGITYDGTFDDSSSLAVPEGETVSLVGGDIRISGDFSTSFEFDNTAVIAPGGQVNVVSVASAGEVLLDQSGSSTTLNVAAFDQLGEVRLTEGALLDASSERRGGTVIIRSGTLMFDTSDVFVDTAGEDGASLGIDIEVTGDVKVIDGFITTDTTGAGTGGDIRISATNVRLIGTPFDASEPGAVIGSRTDRFQTGADGAAGNVELILGNFRNGDQTEASMGTLDSGNASDMEIGSLQIEGQAEVTATTFGPGQAGDIKVSADNVSISGTPGSVFFTGIFANAFESGPGGSIQLTADNVVLTNEGSIQSTTATTGNAGSVTLSLTGRLDVQPGSFILGRGTIGNAAELNITAQDILITGIRDATDPTDRQSGMFTGFDTSAEGAGLGGKVNITAGNLQVTDQGIIRTSTIGSGDGGIIEATVGQLSLTEGAAITAESTSTGNAGNIDLLAKSTILIDNSTVTTEATEASGGNIKLQAEDLIRLNDSTIASSVQGNATTVGGNISLDPEFIILQNSQILAKAVEGQGGNISLVASQAVLVDSFSVLDASSSLGVSGSVNIQAPTKFLSEAIVPLENQPVNVATLYGARCAAGAGGHFSTFVDSKTDSLSPTPGTFLASPLLLSSAQAVTDTSAGPPSPVVLTASIAPLVLGHAGEPMTACP